MTNELNIIRNTLEQMEADAEDKGADTFDIRLSVKDCSLILKKLKNLNVEEVVHCKDCRFLEIEHCYGVCGKAILGMVNPEDFCSRGEKKRGRRK